MQDENNVSLCFSLMLWLGLPDLQKWLEAPEPTLPITHWVFGVPGPCPEPPGQVARGPLCRCVLSAVRSTLSG